MWNTHFGRMDLRALAGFVSKTGMFGDVTLPLAIFELCEEGEHRESSSFVIHQMLLRYPKFIFAFVTPFLIATLSAALDSQIPVQDTTMSHLNGKPAPSGESNREVNNVRH